MHRDTLNCDGRCEAIDSCLMLYEFANGILRFSEIGSDDIDCLLNAVCFDSSSEIGIRIARSMRGQVRGKCVEPFDN